MKGSDDSGADMHTQTCKHKCTMPAPRSAASRVLHDCLFTVCRQEWPNKCARCRRCCDRTAHKVRHVHSRAFVHVCMHGCIQDIQNRECAAGSVRCCADGQQTMLSCFGWCHGEFAKCWGRPVCQAAEGSGRLKGRSQKTEGNTSSHATKHGAHENVRVAHAHACMCLCMALWHPCARGRIEACVASHSAYSMHSHAFCMCFSCCPCRASPQARVVSKQNQNPARRVPAIPHPSLPL